MLWGFYYNRILIIPELVKIISQTYYMHILQTYCLISSTSLMSYNRYLTVLEVSNTPTSVLSPQAVQTALH